MTTNPTNAALGLRERVARAVCDDLARQGGEEASWPMEGGVLDYIDQNCVNMHEVADAAIAAVLEAMERPSSDMLLAVYGDDDFWNEASATQMWQAMLAAFKRENDLPRES